MAGGDNFCLCFNKCNQQFTNENLLKHQKKRVPLSESLDVKAPPIPFENNSIDLFLCNEVLADLPSSPKESVHAQKLLQKYNINII